ncbi:hypothetical protein VTN77DRAFT_687 [Rasamsonia byssochlamydoides]|uniref:uncharacterized protein n=1 Tax=Rasamsonia byssochlamydoides TaxID=89139 RepID=UPI00374458E2
MSTNELSIAFVTAHDVLAAAITLPALGIVAVSLRLYLRRTKQKKFGPDDWFIVGALVSVKTHALGYPSPQYATPLAELTGLTPEQRIVELVDWITWVLMIPANGFIKLSTLYLYRRLFVVYPRDAFDIVSLVIIVICALWMVAFFFATVFGCGRHFDYPWGPLEEIGSCNTNMRLDGLMISDLITDLMVWVLPMPVVWQMRMKMTQKLAVTAILLLAAVSLAAAVVRLIVQLQISNGGYAAHTNVDLTLTILLFWSMIESGLALIASCLPTLRIMVAQASLSASLKSAWGAFHQPSAASREDPSDLVDHSGPAKAVSWNSSQEMPLIHMPDERNHRDASQAV